MRHLTIKAASTATAQGRFFAIAAAWSVDLDGDQIVRGAFADTIRRWRESGKNIPVHWNHQAEASNVIGWVDPALMREAKEGLYVKGELALEESETAREAWRSMEANAVSLSFGFMVRKSEDRSDGVRELHEIDLFEVSIVPHPANPDTRFLELKSAHRPFDRDAFQREVLDGFMSRSNRTESVKKRAAAILAVDDEPEPKRARGPVKIATFEVK